MSNPYVAQQDDSLAHNWAEGSTELTDAKNLVDDIAHGDVLGGVVDAGAAFFMPTPMSCVVPARPGRSRLPPKPTPTATGSAPWTARGRPPRSRASSSAPRADCAPAYGLNCSTSSRRRSNVGWLGKDAAAIATDPSVESLDAAAGDATKSTSRTGRDAGQNGIQGAIRHHQAAIFDYIAPPHSTPVRIVLAILGVPLLGAGAGLWGWLALRPPRRLLDVHEEHGLTVHGRRGIDWQLPWAAIADPCAARRAGRARRAPAGRPGRHRRPGAGSALTVLDRPGLRIPACRAPRISPRVVGRRR